MQMTTEEEEEETEDEDDQNEPPAIMQFSVSFDEYTDEWVFSGVVQDEDPDGCVVQFGVLLQGHECDVGEDGNFELRVELTDDEAGVVSAMAQD